MYVCLCHAHTDLPDSGRGDGVDVGIKALEKVTEAFKIMLKNPKVKGILVNIFGGIMKCDTIATGVITACKNRSEPVHRKCHLRQSK